MLTNKPDSIDETSLTLCTNEESDTQIVLHCLHAYENGYTNIVIRTVDIDVLVIAVTLSHRLSPGSL